MRKLFFVPAKVFLLLLLSLGLGSIVGRVTAGILGTEDYLSWRIGLVVGLIVVATVFAMSVGALFENALVLRLVSHAAKPLKGLLVVGFSLLGLVMLIYGVTLVFREHGTLILGISATVIYYVALYIVAPIALFWFICKILQGLSDAHASNVARRTADEFERRKLR